MSTDIFEALDGDIELLARMSEVRALRKQSLRLFWVQLSLLKESIADMDDLMRVLQQSKMVEIEPEDRFVQWLASRSQQVSAQIESLKIIKINILKSNKTYGFWWLAYYGLMLRVIKLQQRLVAKMEAARSFILEHNANLSPRGPVFTDAAGLIDYLKKL